MNKKIHFFISAVLAVLISPSLFSQEGEAGIKWGGFVKVDLFNDSRAVVAARDDMYMLYPAERKQVTQAPGGTSTSPCGILSTNPEACLVYIYGNTEDLNAVKQTSITAVQSRLSGTITGPTAFGAKTGGFLEVDFFGTANNETWMTRLRHAYVTMDWGSSKILAGMTWYPLFVAGYHPDTVQFSPISPIHPFGRAPQIKFSQDLGGGLNLHIAGVYRAYHADFGPAANSVTTTDGSVYNSRFKRWADKPDIDIQLEYKSDMFSGGITVEANELRPYDNVVSYDGTTTASQIGNNKNKVNGMTWQLFAKVLFDKDNNGQIRFNYVKSQNNANLIMLGGYAEKSNFILNNLTALGISASEATLIKAFTRKEYTPINVTSYWIQPIWGKDIEYSIVLGKSINNGAKDDVGTFYSRGSNIKSVTSVIPQIKFKSGKTMIGIMLGHFEAEYMEDDKTFKAIYLLIKQQAGLAGLTTTYDKIVLGGFTLPDPAVRDSKGKIGDTYKVVDRRLQISVQQNF
ncbi:MAG: hypothetical protein ACK4UJ_03435 [Leptonema sp. (in: bacteria)]